MKKKKKIIFNIPLTLILIASLFMSVGFAAISAVNLDISGNAVAHVQKGLLVMFLVLRIIMLMVLLTLFLEQ